VAVVDEPFARRFFGEASPIGQRFRAVRPEGPGAWTEIVGVVPDLGLNVADDTMAAGYYVPLTSDARNVYLAMRTAGDPMTLVDPVRRALVARDPSFVFNRFQRLEDEAQEDRQFFKWFSLALLGLGGMTLILALAGVYAMMSLIVSRRTREIGVRMALGATTTGIVRAILGRVALQVAIGGAVGAILAVLSLDARSVLVSRLGDGGPWTLPAVLALLVLAGLAATWWPLRRALGVEASEALRAE
jgi:predicted lysophospholipase L1 biosynthesis ABC-type transport system permease subunit